LTPTAPGIPLAKESRVIANGSGQDWAEVEHVRIHQDAKDLRLKVELVQRFSTLLADFVDVLGKFASDGLDFVRTGALSAEFPERLAQAKNFDAAGQELPTDVPARSSNRGLALGLLLVFAALMSFFPVHCLVASPIASTVN